MKSLLTAITFLCGATALAAAPHIAVDPDTVISLDEVRVSAAGPSVTRVDRTGALSFGREAVARAPRVLGEADALRYMQLLPGITTASDYSSGASIDGMGYANNEYRLNGIPVHFPYHFGGIASVFHPRMFDRVRVEKSIHGAGSADVTGGNVDVSSPMWTADTLGAEINAGMIASSGFVCVPVGKRLSVALSGRVSYINAIYGSMLDNDGMKAAYGFNDVDAALNWQASHRDMVRFTFHRNGDHVSYDDRDFSLVTGLEWHNLLAGATWSRETDRFTCENTAYFTRFANTLTLDMQQVRLKAPTAISEGGARGVFSFDEVTRGLGVSFGYGVRHCVITPQQVDLVGFGDGSTDVRGDTHATAGRFWGEAVYSPLRRWRFSAGVDFAGVIGSGDYTAGWIDPRVSATFSWQGGNATLHFGRYHQWLHQVGFSEMGMSSNFKLGPSREAPVEVGYNYAFALSHRFTEWLTLSADGYYKRIGSEPEYFGAVLDIINSDYHTENYIRVARGYNAGFSLMARAEAGCVSVMANYGFCRARRRYGHSGWFNATGSLTHTATATASWHIGHGWSVNAVFNLASGRPYTPIKAIYFIGERLMMEYGNRNSARLPLYHRLDLGADYEFHTGGRLPLTHRVNLSLLNAYGRRNVEMSTFTVDVRSGTYTRRDVSSLYRLLPSLSYTLTL